MRFIRVVLVIAAVTTLPASVLAQAPPPAEPNASGRRPGSRGSGSASSVTEPSGEIKAVTQAILDEIDKRSELMANIEYLCDMIGPRLTGSPNLTKANQWTRDKFQPIRVVESPPRVVDDREGLDAGRREGSRGRAGRAADPSGVGRLEPRRPAAPSAGRSSTSRPSRPTSSIPTKASSRGPGSSSPRSRFSLPPNSPGPIWKAKCGGGSGTS